MLSGSHRYTPPYIGNVSLQRDHFRVVQAERFALKRLLDAPVDHLAEWR
jgi:hypothetical protein